MRDRGFTEVDLRAMFQDATGYHKDVLESRWVVETRHREAKWKVVVEPDEAELKLVAVTAFPVE